MVNLKELTFFRNKEICKEYSVKRVFFATARTFMENNGVAAFRWTICRKAAVVFDGAEDCSITDCEFDQWEGIPFWWIITTGESGTGATFITAEQWCCFRGWPEAVRTLFSGMDHRIFGHWPHPWPKATTTHRTVCWNCLITMTGREESKQRPSKSLCHKNG